MKTDPVVLAAFANATPKKTGVSCYELDIPETQI